MDRILITTSSFGLESEKPLDMIHTAGYEYILNPYQKKLTEDELIALLLEYKPSFLIAGTETIGQRALKSASTFLRLISRCGAGIDNVDWPFAQKLGIKVINTPDAPTHAVAELTVGVLIDLLRGISISDGNIRQGIFEKPMGNLLSGKTIGIIGCGRIGTAVAELLTAFRVRLIGYDKYISSHKLVEMVSFDNLLEMSDVLSLHIPLSDENKHMINAAAINKMKDGVILLNLARGGLVDEDKLFDALKFGKIKSAGLDCFEHEPYNGPLKNLPNVVLTPHIGSYAIEARIEQEVSAVKNILEYIESE